jgi:hypothetical protein
MLSKSDGTVRYQRQPVDLNQHQPDRGVELPPARGILLLTFERDGGAPVEMNPIRRRLSHSNPAGRRVAGDTGPSSCLTFAEIRLRPCSYFSQHRYLTERGE